MDSVDQGQCRVNKPPEKRQEAADKSTIYTAVWVINTSVNLETPQKREEISSCLHLLITKHYFQRHYNKNPLLGRDHHAQSFCVSETLSKPTGQSLTEKFMAVKMKVLLKSVCLCLSNRRWINEWKHHTIQSNATAVNITLTGRRSIGVKRCKIRSCGRGVR